MKKKIISVVVVVVVVLAVFASMGDKTPDGAVTSENGYTVAVVGEEIVKDANDDTALKITYYFENNSDEPVPFLMAVLDEATNSDGEIMEHAYMSGVEGYDITAAMEDVQPGDSIECDIAYSNLSYGNVTINLREYLGIQDNEVFFTYETKIGL